MREIKNVTFYVGILLRFMPLGEKSPEYLGIFEMNSFNTNEVGLPCDELGTVYICNETR